MQSVSDQRIFGTSARTPQRRNRPVYVPLTMNPAEVRLEWQVFLGGIAVSGLMILATRLFGM